MVKIIEKALRSKKGGNFHFDATSTRDVFEILLMILPALLRGMFLKLFLGQTQGLLLVKKHVRLRNPRMIKLGKNFIAEDFCEIQGLSNKGITIGDNVTIGSMSMIRPSGYYGDRMGEGMVIGDNSNIGPYNFVGCSGFVNIGKNVLIGSHVVILAESHIFESTDKLMKSQGLTREGITIEDDCWLGTGSKILDGVTIGEGSIVGAGAVVTKSVEPYSIVAGVPARLIRKRDDK